MSGSGLGLSIVRQVAERHSGTVEAGESPAGGARLTLCLPGLAAAGPGLDPGREVAHPPSPPWRRCSPAC